MPASSVSPFWLRLVCILMMLNTFGCKSTKTDPTIKLPVVGAAAVSDITTATAKATSRLTDVGAGVTGVPTIKEYGICLGTKENPTITDTKITSGNATTAAADISAILTGLTPGTAYYVRGFATHEGGTVYGDQATFTTLSLKAPELTTADATDITTVALSMTGKLTSLGTSDVTQHGHVLSATNQTPTTADTKTEMGAANSVPKDFKSVFTGLKANTTYFIRAYASNATGTGYSEVKTVKTTSEAAPTVSINDATDVGPTSFNITGKVIAIGTADVTQYGHVLSPTNQNPTTADTKTEMGGTNAPKDFRSNFGNLAPSQTYYVRAYALNAVGISYSEVKTVKTSDAQPPTLTTADAIDVGTTSCLIVGNLTGLGSSNVVQHGHVWSSTNQNPTTADSKTEMGAASSVPKEIRSGLFSLKANTTYYVRGYATNATGTGYTDVKSFKTTNDLAPTVITQFASSIGNTSGNFVGTLTSIGTKAVTELGHVWSSGNQNPTVNDLKYTSKTNITTISNPNGSGYDYISPMSNLTPNTTYYVRAYATNSVGTGYGETKTIKTANELAPTAETLAPSSVSFFWAYVDGRVLTLGTSPVTQHGHCWSITNVNPTIADSKDTRGATTTVGTGFTSSRIDLPAATKCYYRTYATSSAGTGYGEVKTFTTRLAIPSVKTNFNGILNGRTTCVIEAKILSMGASNVTVYGHCWSATNNVPTTADSKNQTIPAITEIVSGLGSYLSNLGSLTPNTTYYTRGYATNSWGTAYGEVYTFTTLK